MSSECQASDWLRISSAGARWRGHSLMVGLVVLALFVADKALAQVIQEATQPALTGQRSIIQEVVPTPDPLPIAPDLLRPDSDFPTWWHEMVQRPLGDPQFALPMQLDSAVLQAMVNSAQVRVLRDTAEIMQWAIPRAKANFDPTLFTDTRYTGTSDPVGNTLTTGGPPRFIDETWYGTGGLRRRALSGAQVELSQRLGFQNSNSQFFEPKDQATARLNLTITQPILKGAGQAYNNAVVVLAELDASIAHDEFTREMQSYLLDFHKAYWEIYLQRTVYVQRRRLRDEAADVVNELAARIGVDVAESQLARGRAAIANRETSLIRYDTNVKNAVARFKAIANDPFLDAPQASELIPQSAAGASSGEADLAIALSTALSFRPEIQQASKEITAACERLNVAKRDLLPLLNVVIGSYISGLHANADFAAAYGNQFNQGRPTYWGGLLYEVPYNNRAAQAQHQQRQIEFRRAMAKLEIVTSNVRADVEIAAREVSTTYREMVSAHQAMLSEQKQIDYLTHRWRLLAGDQQTAGIVLNDLLESQDRRASAEFSFVNSQVAHRIAWVNLRRATGTLIDCAALTGNEEILATPMLSSPEFPTAVPAEVVANVQKPGVKRAEGQATILGPLQTLVRQTSATDVPPGKTPQSPEVAPWWKIPASESNGVSHAAFTQPASAQ